MLELLMVHNAFIREVLNGSLFPLSLILSAMIGVFLYDTFRERYTFKTWLSEGGVQTGFVLFPFFLAEGIRSGFVWLAYRNDYIPIPVINQQGVVSSIGFIVSALVIIICLLRGTYLFTPERWGSTPWIVSASFTVAFNVVSVLTDIFAII